MQSMRLTIKNPRLINMGSNPKAKTLLSTVLFGHSNLKLKAFYEQSKLHFSLIGCFPVRYLRRKQVNPRNGCDVCDASQCYIN